MRHYVLQNSESKTQKHHVELQQRKEKYLGTNNKRDTSPHLNKFAGFLLLK